VDVLCLQVVSQRVTTQNIEVVNQVILVQLKVWPAWVGPRVSVSLALC